MRTAFLITLLVVAAAPAARAECSAHSTAQRPRLIELYTSEGCSSCPPAEAWMRSIRDEPDRVGLEFHVDYWDELGWPDPFADARYSARQREHAGREAKSIVYTPQVVIDGRVWEQWPAMPAAPAASAIVAPALRVRVAHGDAVAVELDGGAADPTRDRMFVALTENDLASTVSAGENRGKRLAHDQVVRDFAGPFTPPHASAKLEPPSGFNPAKGFLVAFIEDNASGEIVQVVRLALAECPRDRSEKP